MTLDTDYIRGGTQKARYLENEVVDWPCPQCQSSTQRLLKMERGVLGVVSCGQCDLVRINPRLEKPHEIYQGKQDIYREEWRMILNGKFPHHRDSNYLHDLKLLEKYKPTGNFLDVGTNAGSFLRHARNRGWKLTGVEPSPQLAALARQWWELDIVEGFLETVNLPNHHFDLITLTDVFEHVVNPKEMLAASRRLIKSDGILFIKVPNALFNILKFKVRSWLGRPSDDDFDSYEHVCHYTDRTLTEMLKSCGFEPFKIYVERPVQIPVWHRYVGHYYQHTSPFWMDWKTYTSRALLYQAAKIEKVLSGRVGYLAPNIGCLARPVSN